MMNRWFSWSRWLAIMIKEFIQVRRDRMTLGMMIGLPCLQLILFGYAINSNPKQLPTALVSADHSPYANAMIQTLQNTAYFKIAYQPKTLHEANALLAQGKAVFILSVPASFTRDLIRGEQPQVLLTTDASDPVTVGNAVAAAQQVMQHGLDWRLEGALSHLKSGHPPVQLVVHQKYNPALLTQYNIVPALLGVILTMTMIMITSLAMTREYERGTMENLLATPVRPLEVLLGKVTPYIIIGYVQVSLVLIAAHFVFSVPVAGSLCLLYISAFPFIVANLAVGILFSTIARNQLQAVQMAFFFFLPSLLLSGFMFPFYGMPNWAQVLGNVLPLTHFVRIVRGIVLKGNGLILIWPEIWPMLVFAACALFLGVLRYRQTLD